MRSSQFTEERKTLLQSKRQAEGIPNQIQEQVHNLEEIGEPRFVDLKEHFNKIEFKHLRYVGEGGQAFYKAFAIAIFERAAFLKQDSVEFFEQFERKWKMKLDLPRRLKQKLEVLKSKLLLLNQEYSQKEFFKSFYKFCLQDSYFLNKILKFLRELIKSFIDEKSHQNINGRPLIEHISFQDGFKSLSKFNREIIENKHAYPTTSIFLILASIFTIPVSILNAQVFRSLEFEESKQAQVYYDPERYCAQFCQFNKEHSITILRKENSFFILYKAKENVALMRNAFNAARETLAEVSNQTSANSTKSEALQIIGLGCGHNVMRGQVMDYLNRNFPLKPKGFFDYEDRFIIFNSGVKILIHRQKRARLATLPILWKKVNLPSFTRDP